jgi:hypothetical protein
MFKITFQPPYSNGAWRTQSFNTLAEAQNMIAFYATCGTRARML